MQEKILIRDCCPCQDCVERRKHFHQMCDHRHRWMDMQQQGGPPMPKRMKMSEALQRFRPSVATMAQLLMDGPVEFSGMVLVKMRETGANDVYWPIEVITRAVESELRRFGFLLERHGDTFSARSYRSTR